MTLRKTEQEEIPTQPQIEVAVLGERLNGIAEDVGDLKRDLKEFTIEQRTREDNRVKHEKERDEKIIIIGKSAEKAHERIDNLEDFQESVEEMLPAMKNMAKLSLGLSVPFILFIAKVIGEWVIAKAQGLIP